MPGLASGTAPWLDERREEDPRYASEPGVPSSGEPSIVPPWPGPNWRPRAPIYYYSYPLPGYYVPPGDR